MNFVLTNHWFDKINNGDKTHEYRAKTNYWTKRVNNLSKGDYITFSRGYTKTRIKAQIIDIQYISKERLRAEDREAFKFMQDKCHAFWDINFNKEA